MQLTNFRVFLLLLIVGISSGLVGWHFASGSASSAANNVVTPSWSQGACTWTISVNSNNQPEAHALIGGLSVSPGDNVIGTAGQDVMAFLSTNIIANNQKLCFNGSTFSTSTGLTLKGFSNITLDGIYGETKFVGAISAGTVLTIGDQNSVDGNFHAWNITVTNIILDGGGLSNSACIDISDALNVWIRYDQFQNCLEQATGCFRLTSWSVPQALNKNIFVDHNNLLACKITLTSTTNGWFSYNNMYGLRPGSSTRALIDFSIGDAGAHVQILSNYCLCYNIAAGWWTSGSGGQFASGLENIKNVTVTGNILANGGFNGFITSVDAASPLLTGLYIYGNTYADSTGPFINICYGTDIQVIDNFVSDDTSPLVGNSAITFSEASCHSAETTPTLITVSRNTIQKWGGIGIVGNFTNGQISDNNLYDNNQCGPGNGCQPGSNGGILLGKSLSNVVISGNDIVSDVTSGPGQFVPIEFYQSGFSNLTITGNDLYYRASITSPVFYGGLVSGINVHFSNNLNYDPIGKVANFVTSSSLAPWGTTSTVVASTTYTVNGVDELITSTGGTGVSINIGCNGNNYVSASATLTNQLVWYGCTVNFGAFSVAPTVTVFAD